MPDAAMAGPEISRLGTPCPPVIHQADMHFKESRIPHSPQWSLPEAIHVHLPSRRPSPRVPVVEGSSCYLNGRREVLIPSPMVAQRKAERCVLG